MTWVLVITALAGGLLFSAFFSGAETGIYCLNRLRLHLAARNGDKRAVGLTRVLADEPGLLSVTLMGTNVMNYVATTACAYMLAELVGLSQMDTEVYTVVCVTPVVFVLGEVVPKSLFRMHADVLMARLSLFLILSDRLFRMTGLVWCFTRLAAAAARLGGGRVEPGTITSVPKRRMAILLQEALAGSPRARDQSALIEYVCRLPETPVHAVMVPYHRVIAVADKADRSELGRLARAKRCARIPVFAADQRRIVGFALIDKLLVDGTWATVGERIEPVVEVDAQDSVADVIAKMQNGRHEMAVVVDGIGHMRGIVTLKDLLSELVGELASEEMAQRV